MKRLMASADSVTINFLTATFVPRTGLRSGSVMPALEMCLPSLWRGLLKNVLVILCSISILMIRQMSQRVRIVSHVCMCFQTVILVSRRSVGMDLILFLSQSCVPNAETDSGSTKMANACPSPAAPGTKTMNASSATTEETASSGRPKRTTASSSAHTPMSSSLETTAESSATTVCTST